MAKASSSNKPRTSQEATALLVMEEVDRLLDRLTELQPAIEQAVSNGEAIQTFQVDLAAIVDHAKASAVRYVIESTNEVAARLRAELRDGLDQAAAEAWKSAASRHFEQLAGRVAKDAQRANAPGRWSSFVATALVSALGGAVTAAAIIVMVLSNHR